MRCLIWGTGITYDYYINIIKYNELIKNIEVVGVTSNTTVFNKILGYPYIPKENVKDIFFEIVIIMADGDFFSKMKKEALDLGINHEKIISYRALTIPNLDLNKYMKISINVPTIFSNNCWGGVVYNRLGLEFVSPLINMFESDKDYMSFLHNPDKYINTPLIYKEDGFDVKLQIHYPICLCDDIILHFNHYMSFSEANECWERRKKRIKWNNLFVMMYTENKEIAMQFAELPYKKKICFVPFLTDKEALFYVDFRNKNEFSKLPFWKVVIDMARGANTCFDILELLYSGTIVRISE